MTEKPAAFCSTGSQAQLLSQVHMHAAAFCWQPAISGAASRGLTRCHRHLSSPSCKLAGSQVELWHGPTAAHLSLQAVGMSCGSA